MLFNSYIFIFLFLPIALIGYYGLNYLKQYKLALCFLVGMSAWFCGYMNVNYLVMLIISMLSNYAIAEVIDKVKKKYYRTCLLVLGVVWNLGVLFYFKYYNFFLQNMNDIFNTDISFVELMLPLGISFYTFQQIAYIVDVYRKDCPQYGFLEYAYYITFFPKLIQGPLASAEQMIDEIRKQENRFLNYTNMCKGLYAFALGLGKKVLIADTLSIIVQEGYHNPYRMNATTALLIMLVYTLQIYFDFSGYCDMALGIGYMFNIKLPINFNSPYKAVSIDEFWHRWHMSLTQFLTRYVYFPLGGSRKGKIRTYVNILIVFLLSGLWHGANWTFILWGAMHGIAKVIERLGKRWIEKIPKVIRGVWTFGFVTVAWSLFRAGSLAEVKELWGQIFLGEYGRIQSRFAELFNNLIELKILARLGFSELINTWPEFPLLLFVLFITLACFVVKNTQQKLENMKFTGRKIVIIVFLFVWCLASLTNANEFLYVNF